MYLLVLISQGPISRMAPTLGQANAESMSTHMVALFVSTHRFPSQRGVYPTTVLNTKATLPNRVGRDFFYIVPSCHSTKISSSSSFLTTNLHNASADLCQRFTFIRLKARLCTPSRFHSAFDNSFGGTP
jgi:hypothetical protein